MFNNRERPPLAVLLPPTDLVESLRRILCSPAPPADVCECGDWEANHVLRRGACRICRGAPGGDLSPEPCLRYRFSHQEPMPPAMYAGLEPVAPTAETRPRYVTLLRIEAALAAAGAQEVGKP